MTVTWQDGAQAVEQAARLLGQGKPANVALTGGFHWAFWVCGTIALLALPATATLLLRRRTAPASRHEAAPAPEAVGTTGRVSGITR